MNETPKFRRRTRALPPPRLAKSTHPALPATGVPTEPASPDELALAAEIRRRQTPIPILTAAQRAAIAATLPTSLVDLGSQIEEIVRLGLALKASHAAKRGRVAGRRELSRLASNLRGTIQALNQLDLQARLRIVASSPIGSALGPDLSGVQRSDLLDTLAAMLSHLATGADTFAQQASTGKGAPALPEYLVSTAELLAQLWQEHGPPSRQSNRKHPDQKIAQSQKDESFNAWLLDLFAGELHFASKSQVNTVVAKLAGKAESRFDAEAAREQ